MAWEPALRHNQRTRHGQRIDADAQVTFKPTATSVTRAIDSLYADRIKPVGRILLKRLGERATVSDIVPRIDPKRLRQVCESCSSIRVEAEEGGEYVALLVERAQDFVDVSSNADPYPPEMWAEANTYFASLVGDEAVLPGGRYACAQVLAARHLPFLAGRCLGEVCHIIALAISHNRMLGYRDGCIVPYNLSEAGTKEHCAAWQQPACNPKRSEHHFAVASWDQARACLMEIFLDSGGTVPLPNVKRLFHSRFYLDLSETALGYARLAELLNDGFHDLCSVEKKDGGGYLVVQKHWFPQVPMMPTFAPDVFDFVCLSTAPPTSSSTCPLNGDASNAENRQPRMTNTVEFAWEGAPTELQEDGLPVFEPTSTSGDCGHVDDFIESLQSPEDWWVHPDTHLCHSRGSSRLQGGSADSDFTGRPTFSELLESELMQTGECGLHPCSPEERLSSLDEEASQPLPSCKPEWTQIFSTSSLPPEEDCIGNSVRNTFVHLSTTNQGEGSARRRTRSLPKDYFSSKDAEETARHQLNYLQACSPMRANHRLHVPSFNYVRADNEKCREAELSSLSRSSSTLTVKDSDLSTNRLLDARDEEIAALQAQLLTLKAANDALRGLASDCSSSSSTTGVITQYCEESFVGSEDTDSKKFDMSGRSWAAACRSCDWLENIERQLDDRADEGDGGNWSRGVDRWNQVWAPSSASSSRASWGHRSAASWSKASPWKPSNHYDNRWEYSSQWQTQDNNWKKWRHTHASDAENWKQKTSSAWWR